MSLCSLCSLCSVRSLQKSRDNSSANMKVAKREFPSFQLKSPTIYFPGNQWQPWDLPKAKENYPQFASTTNHQFWGVSANGIFRGSFEQEEKAFCHPMKILSQILTAFPMFKVWKSLLNRKIPSPNFTMGYPCFFLGSLGTPNMNVNAHGIWPFHLHRDVECNVMYLSFFVV